MLTFTDDFSRYTTAYFIKSKSEVLSKLMEYVNSVEKHTGHQFMKLNILAEEDVKVLRRDNGGEYTPGGWGGGHLSIFGVGMCRPGLQIGTPF